ncbi:MAG: DNA polymerase III subunit alpha, partial [Longispora sp.]|nr:DNA polymerase III subunit alpha [Longispora sp. (in: high G+C Gram-positive bacteria)]
MRQLLRLMKPDNFEDISAVLALYRPGPMGANSHINYALRKNKQQDIVPIHPELEADLEDILGVTHGLIVYQEQVQRAAVKLAGYSLGQADNLRRAMGKKKKEVLDKEFVPFREGMRTNGYSDEATQALWDVLVPFADYAFNKAHTAAYGMISYWTAYLKANYPAEYMAALLTSVGDDKDKMALYLSECRKMGIKVLPPDVNESADAFTPVGTDIRFGLGAVRNVGTNVVSSIIATRDAKGKYTSFPDFLSKAELVVCNKRTIESLIKAGAFDSLGHTRKSLVEHHESAVDAVVGVKRQEAVGQFDLFGGLTEASDDGLVGLDLNFSPTEWPRKELLAFERDMLGLYVSDHPLAGAERILKANSEQTIAEVIDEDTADRLPVTIAGMISSVQRRITKQGASWAIVVVEDLGASVEVLFFPKSYELLAPHLREDIVVTVKGHVNKRDQAISVVGADMMVLEILDQDLATNPPVTLNTTWDKITEPVVTELKRVLLGHKGECPVRLKLRNRDGESLFALDADFRVRNDVAFRSEIKTLLGAGGVD